MWNLFFFKCYGNASATMQMFLKHYHGPKESFSLLKFFWIYNFFREFEIMHFFLVTVNSANFDKMEKMGNDINGVNKTSKSILDRKLFLFLKHYNSPKGSFSLSVKFFWIFFREFEIMHFFGVTVNSANFDKMVRKWHQWCEQNFEINSRPETFSVL